MVDPVDRLDLGQPARVHDRLGGVAFQPAALQVGIRGEHGGDPDTVKFCHQIGLNYVSCSPFRVPIARRAAAQAALGK